VFTELITELISLKVVYVLSYLELFSLNCVYTLSYFELAKLNAVSNEESEIVFPLNIVKFLSYSLKDKD
jgi:hypothetical protein